MPFFESAEQLLKPGETGLFLFTDGRFFTQNADKRGSSGFWKLDSQRKIDRVVIFRWSIREGERCVELFSALPDGFDGPTDEGRYAVRLLNIHFEGNTTRTWEDFVGTLQHPVTYVTHNVPIAKHVSSTA
jgi:hypothetical protein